MEEVVTLFKAMADETRLRILKLLEGGELCVCDITAGLEMTQPNVSFHLGILKDAGLVKDRREGRWMHYDLDLGDLMSRVIVPTALGRLSGKVVAADRARLKKFMAAKADTKCCSLKLVR
jgi:ArsR family transcriptional regulator